MREEMQLIGRGVGDLTLPEPEKSKGSCKKNSSVSKQVSPKNGERTCIFERTMRKLVEDDLK